jgi:alkylation response protein AidB-like acyl-CoA dehydrogenase
VDLEFTAEQELLRESLRRFLAEQAPISPNVRSMLDDARGTSDDVWLGLASLGVTDLLTPGAGTGMVDTAVVLEELGRAVHPGPFTSSAVGAVSVVALAGSDADRGAWLPGLGSGETVGSVALLEPRRRYEWRAPVTRATADGDGWRVDGTKVHVRDGVAADVWFVTASAGDGLGVFAVSRGDDGGTVSIEPTPTVDGTRKEATLTFHGARARRVGDGDATDAVAQVVDRLALADVVDGVGAAARALELAVEYARTRVQFDRPIGSFQAVQHLCADMLQAVELARAGAYYACWAIDAADDTERHRAVTMAKAFASDELYRVGASAVQVFGGVGFTWEHDVHLYLKRLMSLRTAGGTTDDHLADLATIALRD